MKKPRVTFDRYAVATIDEYHSDFAAIWARDASERTAYDLWLHVVDHVSRIARAIRRQEPPAVIDDVADSFVWILSFIAYCQIAGKHQHDPWYSFTASPSQLLWTKYPGMCPSCLDHRFITLLGVRDGESALAAFNGRRAAFRSEIDRLVERATVHESCTCLDRQVCSGRYRETVAVLRADLDDLRRQYASALSNAGKAVTRVAALEAMFSDIYANFHHVLSLENIAFHLLEEVGEATKALKDLYTFDDSREPYSPELLQIRKRQLQDELADVLAWLFALALKLKSTYVRHAREYRSSVRPGSPEQDGPGLTFAEIIWSKYGMTRSGANWDQLKCPGCQAAPCACPRDIRMMRRASGTDPEARTGTPLAPGAPEPGTTRDLVFFSYSHKDRQWLDRFRVMLNPLIRHDGLSIWDDTQIQTGNQWRVEIESALRRASVAVLLVSSDFLASDFIVEKELPQLLDVARSGGLRVIWVPLRACMYGATDLASYQAAHDPHAPLDGLPVHEQEKALVKICETIQQTARDSGVRHGPI